MTLPNQLTLLRIALTPVFFTLLFIPARGAAIASFIVFIIAAVTDWYDGYTARKLGKISRWGQFLDPLADKILVLSAFTGFWLLGYFPLWMLLVILIRDSIITFIRIRTALSGCPMVTRFYGKIKTFLQMTAIPILFIYHYISKYADLADSPIFLQLSARRAMPILIGVVTIITAVTGLFYLIENRQCLSNLFQGKMPLSEPQNSGDQV